MARPKRPEDDLERSDPQSTGGAIRSAMICRVAGTVDSNEIVLGLGAVPNGLTSHQVRRIVADITAAADVVALTIAEFFPRQVMHLQRILTGFPLITPPTQ
jgi:hypothetical protein